jgi:hypothetical protein
MADMGDLIHLGAAYGFIEEAVKEEENLFEEDVIGNPDDIDSIIPDITDTNLILLYNQNPSLVKHIIKRFKESKMPRTDAFQNKSIVDKLNNSDTEIQCALDEIDQEIMEMSKENNASDRN